MSALVYMYLALAVALLLVVWRPIAAVVAAKVLWWLVRWHPWFTLLALVTGLLGFWAGHAVVALVWTLATAGLVVWRWTWPASFESWVGCRFRTAWRGELLYRWRWHEAMALFGLAARVEADDLVTRETPRRVDHRPQLMWIRCGRTVDRLLIRHRLGHEEAHWDIRTAALTQSFRAKSCTVSPSRSGYVWLTFRVKETLAATVRPWPTVAADRLDLEAVPVGVTEDGHPWTLRLAGTHVLIGGCMGSGKSSVIWSTLHALAPAIAAGLVEVWAIDPKGGMELTHGDRDNPGPMFRRYAYPRLIGGDVTPESMWEMVELLEDAARLVLQRADRLRGVARKHTPTPGEPAVIVIVDELAYLTTYLPDPILKKRAALALGVLLSQGRAPGVTVVGAIQDVRKEALPQRDLIPTRIALRLPEASQTDLVLGDGAHKRGAACDRIAEALPGVGYVLLDGQHTPTRVRASWLDDQAIRRLGRDYPAPEVIDTTASGDEPDDGIEDVAA